MEIVAACCLCLAGGKVGDALWVLNGGKVTTTPAGLLGLAAVQAGLAIVAALLAGWHP